MNARAIAAVAAVAATALFAGADIALADTGLWTSVAAWTPGRVLLGLSGVVFAAALTRVRAN